MTKAYLMDLIVKLRGRVDYLEEKTKIKKPESDETSDYTIIYHGLTFDDVFNCVEKRSLQSIFREIENVTLAGVLFSFQTPEEVEKIKNNVSKNHFQILLDYIKDGYFSNNAVELTQYREEFMDKVKHLEMMGEIVVHRDDDKGGNDLNHIKTDWGKYKEEDRKRREEADIVVKNWMTEVGLDT